ncbi:hypothetical protein GCM10009677_21540 [Sphaerisporangium rubeum]
MSGGGAGGGRGHQRGGGEYATKHNADKLGQLRLFYGGVQAERRAVTCGAANETRGGPLDHFTQPRSAAMFW